MNQQYFERGQEIVQAAPQLYVDLDVEADGKPGYGSLLSVGAVTPWGDEFYREIKPTSDVWVPSQRQFCEDHNLQRERLLAEGMHPAQAMRELQQWTREQQARYEKVGSVLTAFNASFDYPWIDLQMTRAKLNSPYGIAGYCIKSLAQVFSQDRYDWRETSKGRLPADIVPDGDFTHNALEDAAYQQKIHFALVGRLAIAGRANPKKKEQNPKQHEEDRKLAFHENDKGTLHACSTCNSGVLCEEAINENLQLLTSKQAGRINKKAKAERKAQRIQDEDDLELFWDSTH